MLALPNAGECVSDRTPFNVSDAEMTTSDSPDEQRLQFRRDGFVALPQFFSDTE